MSLIKYLVAATAALSFASLDSESGFAKTKGSGQAACTCTCDNGFGTTQTKYFTLLGSPMVCTTYGNVACVIVNEQGHSVDTGTLKNCSGHAKTTVSSPITGVSGRNGGTGVFANPR